jgi:hypothetical protein
MTTIKGTQVLGGMNTWRRSDNTANVLAQPISRSLHTSTSSTRRCIFHIGWTTCISQQDISVSSVTSCSGSHRPIVFNFLHVNMVFFLVILNADGDLNSYKESCYWAWWSSFHLIRKVTTRQIIHLVLYMSPLNHGVQQLHATHSMRKNFIIRVYNMHGLFDKNGFFCFHNN